LDKVLVVASLTDILVVFMALGVCKDNYKSISSSDRSSSLIGKFLVGIESSMTRLAKSQKAQFTFVNEQFWLERNEASGL
jgi:hypothetical protein